MKFDGRALRFAAVLEAPVWLLVVVLIVVTLLVVGTSIAEFV